MGTSAVQIAERLVQNCNDPLLLFQRREWYGGVGYHLFCDNRLRSPLRASAQSLYLPLQE